MGKTQPIQGFEPLTPEDHESAATAAYMEAFHLLDTDGAAAREAFTAAVARFPDDPLAAFHLKRLEAGEVGSTIVMTEK
jgi:adenylate cyclase